MTETQTKMEELFATFLLEVEKLETKNVKACAPRARKALNDLGKLIKVRRAEIQAFKETI